MVLELSDAVTKVWGLFSDATYYHIFELGPDDEARSRVPGAQYQAAIRSGESVLKFPLSSVDSVKVQQR